MSVSETPHAPRLSITAEGAMYPPDQQARLLDVARAADQAGVDYIETTEHVLMGLNALHAGQGWEPHHLEMPQPEVMTTLAAMVGATRTINVLSSVVIAPLRPAGLLAKQAATLHALSGGRFTMGVTASWQKDEYDALGVPFERRGQILDDTIGACRALWASAPASWHSPTVNFDGMFCSPRPKPGERIKVWFGGKFTPRQIRRIVSLGDGWMPYGGLGMSLEQKAEAIATLRERFTAAGPAPPMRRSGTCLAAMMCPNSVGVQPTSDDRSGSFTALYIPSTSTIWLNPAPWNQVPSMWIVCPLKTWISWSGVGPSLVTKLFWTNSFD
jgi:probable F420-dependent oxidoreductase